MRLLKKKTDEELPIGGAQYQSLKRPIVKSLSPGNSIYYTIIKGHKM